MKKGMKNFLSVMGALALLAGIGVGVYYGNGTVHKWTDEQIDKWKNGNSSSSSTSNSGFVSNSGSSETAVSSDGKLGIFLPTGHVFNAVKLNDTKTCIATLAPANVSDSNILWTTSDSSKVSIANATTSSGIPQTLTLVAFFDGSVTITATAEADSSITASFKVTNANFIANGVFKGFICGGACSSSGSNPCGSFNYYNISQADHVLTYSYNNYMSSSNIFALYEVWGVRTGAVSGCTLASYSSSVAIGGYNVPLSSGGLSPSKANSYAYFVQVNNGSKASVKATVKVTCDQFTTTYSTGAYVAPTGISGLTDQTF